MTEFFKYTHVNGSKFFFRMALVTSVLETRYEPSVGLGKRDEMNEHMLGESLPALAVYGMGISGTDSRALITHPEEILAFRGILAI